MILITLGDPLSINIEILASLLSPSTTERKNLAMYPIVLIGSFWHWHEQLKELNIPQIQTKLLKNPKLRPKTGLWFYNVVTSQTPTRKLSTQQRGKIAFASLEGIKEFLTQKPLVVLTAPINKHITQQGGFKFPGQTEYFEHVTKQQGLMLLSNSALKVGLVTNHLPVKKISSALSIQLIEQKLDIFYKSLQTYFKISQPRIGVCGLNPHSGDNGTIGSEDHNIVYPAIINASSQLERPNLIQGPFSADTLFWQARQGEFDGILAMYHDQGLAPIKTLSFDETIHLTCGLNFLRISPDHGPASNLYLKKKASPKSFKQCFQVIHHHLSEK